MVLITALLMLEESRLNKPVLPKNHPRSYQQRIDTTDAATRILELTPSLPSFLREQLVDTTNAAARILELTPSLPASHHEQHDPKKSIDEIWRTLMVKAQDVEIIVLDAENQHTT